MTRISEKVKIPIRGVEEITPPIGVIYQMRSRSFAPQQQGLIRFQFTPQGLAVGWYPENALQVIPWDELAWMAGQQSPDLEREVTWIKEQAQAEGYTLAINAVREQIATKVLKLRNLVDETGNPFLKKYAAALQAAMDETEAMFK